MTVIYATHTHTQRRQKTQKCCQKGSIRAILNMESHDNMTTGYNQSNWEALGQSLEFPFFIKH